MQDLSKMSVTELIEDVYADFLSPVSAIAELTRRMTPPVGYVRLPDGRDVPMTVGVMCNIFDALMNAADAEAARAKEAK